MSYGFHTKLLGCRLIGICRCRGDVTCPKLVWDERGGGTGNGKEEHSLKSLPKDRRTENMGNQICPSNCNGGP